MSAVISNTGGTVRERIELFALPGAVRLTTTARQSGRAAAISFFSLVALAQFAFVIPFQRRGERRRARAAWLHRWCRVACRILGLRVEVLGAIPHSGLLVANHLSYLDIVALSSLRPCVFIAKSEVARWPLFGLLARCGGSLFVERQRRTDAARVAQEMTKRLRDGELLVMFPEGTSSGGASVLPFSSSLLAPLEHLDCEVTAGALSYTLARGSAADEVCYWRDMTLLPHLSHLFTIPQIELRIAFAQPAVTRTDRKEMARELHDVVVRLKVPL